MECDQPLRSYAHLVVADHLGPARHRAGCKTAALRGRRQRRGYGTQASPAVNDVNSEVLEPGLDPIPKSRPILTTLTKKGRKVAGVVTWALALFAVVPACSSPSSQTSNTTSTSGRTTSSTSSPVTVPHASFAQLAACKADAQLVEVALQTYMVQKGSFPTPPSPWSAASYAANFGPLIPQYMHSPPATGSYVVEYDSSGHVWVAPPGSYSVGYNPGEDFSANPNACDAAGG